MTEEQPEDHEALKKKGSYLPASGGWDEVLLTGESGKEKQSNTATLYGLQESRET